MPLASPNCGQELYSSFGPNQRQHYPYAKRHQPDGSWLGCGRIVDLNAIDCPDLSLVIPVRECRAVRAYEIQAKKAGRNRQQRIQTDDPRGIANAWVRRGYRECHIELFTGKPNREIGIKRKQTALLAAGVPGKESCVGVSAPWAGVCANGHGKLIFQSCTRCALDCEEDCCERDGCRNAKLAHLFLNFPGIHPDLQS